MREVQSKAVSDAAEKRNGDISETSIENIEPETESDIQYILDENGNLATMLKSETIKNEHPIRYKECNAFEVFVRIPVYENENYYCSNYGRVVNNYRKKNFHLHREGNVHVTIFDKNNYRAGDYYTEKLVAMCFLKKPDGRYNKVWHKDGNINNCWYKNLIYVTDEQYSKLKSGAITVDDLPKQEYIEYRNRATYKAYHVYYGIKERCSDTEDKEECYNGAVLCDEWADNPKVFVKWYLEHYYTVDDERMAVDKDLFGNGSKVYSSENCCVVPQGINTMLSNCKKPYYKEDYGDALLPFGVSKCDDGYFGSIRFTSNGNQIRLSTFDTPEEAFQEYKIMKKADVLLMAAKYKDKIPDYIYKKLLELEIEPF